MNMILVALFVCLVGLQVAVGQLIEDGKCPTVTPEKNFDPSKHFGKYFEYLSYDGPLRKGNPECVVYDVKNSDGKKDAEGFSTYPYTRVVHFANGTSQQISAKSYAKNSDPETLGKFDVIFEELGEGVIQMNILQTADHFQVVFYCQELPSDKHCHQPKGWFEPVEVLLSKSRSEVVYHCHNSLSGKVHLSACQAHRKAYIFHSANDTFTSFTTGSGCIMKSITFRGVSHAIVFTRAPTPSPADVDAIKSVLKNNNIDFVRLAINNYNCDIHVNEKILKEND